VSYVCQSTDLWKKIFIAPGIRISILLVFCNFNYSITLPIFGTGIA